MNPILKSPLTIGKIVKKQITIGSGKKFIPCSPKCICLMYLDLKDFKSQSYYENCFRTQVKN